jgi:thiamine-monophosphate kinase
MGRALSDIAAMGGMPSFAVAAAILRRTMTMTDARGLTRGLEAFGVPVVGGDLKSHDGPCVVTVSVLGEMGGARPVLRRGARPGDVLLVTGRLGNSMAGHHLRFAPRLREGRLFATRYRVNAMIDVSDGLARDLAHLGVGAELSEAAIPCRGTVEQALHDGEDYELLVAAPPRTARRIERAGLGAAIGTVSGRAGIRLHRRDGRVERVAPQGWEHRFGVS